MVDLNSPDLVTMLASAHSGAPDPRLADLYAALEGEWQGLGRQAYPDLQFDLGRLVPDVFCKLTFQAASGSIPAGFSAAHYGDRLFLGTLAAVVLESHSAANSSRYEDRIFGAFRRQWQAISLAKWPDYPDEFESATQDACVKLTTLAREKSLGAIISLERYATRVFINRMRDQIRHERGSTHTPAGGLVPCDDKLSVTLRSPAPSPVDALERDERRQLLHAALDRLTANKKRLLLLKYFHGLPDQEIARTFDLTHNAVRLRLTRLREELRADPVLSAYFESLPDPPPGSSMPQDQDLHEKGTGRMRR